MPEALKAMAKSKFLQVFGLQVDENWNSNREIDPSSNPVA
jgi:hypothetical protein